MDRHLVVLVKQTERYTDLLNEQLLNDADENSGNGSSSISKPMTIEQVLNGHEFQLLSPFQQNPRKGRNQLTDYHSLAHQLDQNQELEFYGESTTKDVGQGRRGDFEDKDASVNTSDFANDNTSRSVRPQRKKRVKFADDVNNANVRTRNTSSDDDNGNDADDDVMRI